MYGFISGPLFSLCYAFCGILWGLAARKFNRRNILTVACLAWSLTSIAIGSTSSVVVIAVMRALLGAFQSAGEPTMFSLLSDYFPKDQIARANSAIVASSFFGAGCSSMMIALIQNYGWRNGYKILGVAGILISAIAMIFIKLPMRGRFEPEEPEVASEDTPTFKRKRNPGIVRSVIKSLTDVFANKVARYSSFGSACRYTFNTIGDYFLPAYYLLAFP